MKAQVIEVQICMKTFHLYFRCLLGQIILNQIDNFFQTLQDPTISASEGYSIVVKKFRKGQS